MSAAKRSKKTKGKAGGANCDWCIFGYGDEEGCICANSCGSDLCMGKPWAQRTKVWYSTGIAWYKNRGTKRIETIHPKGKYL